MSDDQKPFDPAQVQALAKVRRLMMVASATTFIGVAAVFGVIGYKVFKSGEDAPAASPAMADVTDALPTGARVVATAIGGDHILVTIEVAGITELRTYDPDTLKPVGRLRLPPQP